MHGRAPSSSFGTAGTAAIEFALVLPMLLVMVLGAVEVGFRILSHASMNATMARVPDQVRRATDTADMNERLDALAGLPLGLGFAAVAFDDVVEQCICPEDAPLFRDEPAARPRDCPVVCAAGADALHFYVVTGGVTVPSLVPARYLDGTRVEATVMVLRP